MCREQQRSGRFKPKRQFPGSLLPIAASIEILTKSLVRIIGAWISFLVKRGLSEQS